MPEDHDLDTKTPLSNAERQARYRARRKLAESSPRRQARRIADRRSRPQRWKDAVAELLALQAAYAAWLETLPDTLAETPTAEALQAIVDLDLDALIDVQLPLGYGRD